MKFTYLQLNIWIGGKYQKELLSFIQELQPDVIALQEVVMPTESSVEHPSLHTLELIKSSLNTTYSTFAPYIEIRGDKTFTKGYSAQFGSAIVSKFPIVHSTDKFYIGEYQSIDHDTILDWSDAPRNLLNAEIQLSDKQSVTVYTTHGVWGKEGRDNENRDIMSNTLIDAVKGKKSVILSGDLNTEPDTRCIQNISKTIPSVFENRLTSTFNKKKKNLNVSTWDFVVDYVFASSDLHVVKSYVPDVDVSDHVPLVCEFEI